MKKIILTSILFSIFSVFSIAQANLCSNATVLTVGASPISGTTVGSTSDGSTPSCGSSTWGANVWYKFTATSAQSRIDLSAVWGFDPVIAIYNSCSGSSIQCVNVGSLNQNETITFTTVTGTTYLINVAQYTSASGTFLIAVHNTPVNNDCSNAINLTVGATSISGATYYSTSDGIAPNCFTNSSNGNVWYKFTATSTFSKIDLTSVFSLNPILAIHSSCGGGSIQCVNNNGTNSGETISFTSVVGTTYLINVLNYGSSTGAFNIAVSNSIPPPINDNCINATNLIVGASCISGTTVSSTFDGVMPTCGGSSNVGNVWYAFTATSTLSKIDLTNVSIFNPVLSIYGTCGGNAIQCTDAGNNNQGETITFATVTGTTYLINVKQYDATAGTFCVVVSNAPPFNDNCSNAINLAVDSTCILGTTINATNDGGTTSCGSGLWENVWYKFTATSTLSKIDVTNVLGLGFNPVLAVFSSCGGSEIQCLNVGGANQNETIIFPTSIGTTYLINVKKNASSAGTFCIAVSNIISPANDNCANAINITVDAPCISGTTVNSTLDVGTTSCGTNSAVGNVWYKFTATSTQSKIDITNVWGFDPILAVYNFCGGASTKCANAGSSNQDETISFTTVIGTTYLICVKQYSSYAGTFCISVTQSTGMGISEFSNSVSIYPNPNNGTFTLEAKTEGTYSIINELGQTVKQVQLRSDNDFTMNIDGLSNGIYFVVGYNNNQISRQKVIVTK